MCASKTLTYEYMDDEDHINDEYKCFICKHPFQSPVTHTLCQNDFCKDCIEKYDTCPGCNAYSIDNIMKIFPLVPISTRIVLNPLNQLLVRCLLCQEINIQRGNYEDHEEICPKKIIRCQSIDMKCPWKGRREKLNAHLKKCIFQKIRPIINKYQRKITKIKKEQSQMKLSIKNLEKQISFILAFINEGIPMTRNCTISSNQCRYKTINQWDFLTCRICDKLIEFQDIAVHACNDSAICSYCFNESYLLNAKKSKSHHEEEEDYSSISTLQSY